MSAFQADCVGPIPITRSITVFDENWTVRIERKARLPHRTKPVQNGLRFSGIRCMQKCGIPNIRPLQELKQSLSVQCNEPVAQQDRATAF